MAKLYQLTARKDGRAIAGMIGVPEAGLDEMKGLLSLEHPDCEITESEYDPSDLLSIPECMRRNDG